MGRNPVDCATAATIEQAIADGAVEPPLPACIDYATYRASGGYKTWRECIDGGRNVDAVIAELESSALRGLGGAGFPVGRKWKIVRAEAAPRLMQFFADESCGQCTPCRVGTEKAVGLLAQPKWERAPLAELSQAMADASICGLGQAAPNPIACVVKYFPQELE